MYGWKHSEKFQRMDLRKTWFNKLLDAIKNTQSKE
jgi:hypothetical protein